MKRHVKQKPEENVPLLEDFKCNSCTKVFSSKDNLLNHEKLEHVSSSHEGKGAEIYQTSKETNSEQSQKDLKKETIACGKGKFLVGCAVCGKNFSEANKLAEHIESVHKRK